MELVEAETITQSPAWSNFPPTVLPSAAAEVPHHTSQILPSPTFYNVDVLIWALMLLCFFKQTLSATEG